MKAFPHDSTNQYGMDLRDYFAGLAMQGLIASHDDLDYEYLSSVSYLMADAMMEARSQ